MRLQEYSDVSKWTLSRLTSPEIKCVHPTSPGREICTPSVSQIFTRRRFQYAHWENANVMLEF